MINFREIKETDDPYLYDIIRKNLEAYELNIPGTAYFDENLAHLSQFYISDKDSRFYLIAENDGEVVGGVGLDRLEFMEECAELQKLYLKDNMKGNGFGYKLVEKIEEKARQLGYKKMYLETHTNLKTAIHVYKKCGYVQIPKPKEVIHSTMNRFFLKQL
ncbi:MAG: GNAT family N-acetyltransferase [Lachnospiraceae bacterium]|nr:GNAT family N-acetyltransferase [Lachnospiraceae bacterium]